MRTENANAGTTLPIAFNVTYKSTGEDVLAVDIESALFMLKRRLSDADTAAKLTKELTDGISAADGTVTVTLDPTDTKDLDGKHFGTLRLFLVSGAVLDWEDTTYPGIPYIELNFRQGSVEAITA